MYCRKKPEFAKAFQLDRREFKELPEWIKSCSHLRYTEDDQDMVTEIYIDTMEGTLCACENDWIIQGIKGELYLCKPGIFDATYDKVSLFR